jgi:hypothetical protein
MMAEGLWCVNVIGPDDVHAMPSLREAMRVAQRFNTYWMKRTEHESDKDYVMLWANVTQWPHDAEGHAADLQRHVEGFSLLTREERAAACAAHGLPFPEAA